MLCHWQRLGHQDGEAVNEEGLWVLVQVLLGMRKVVGTVLTCEGECVTGVNVYLQLHAVHARICYNVVKTCVYMCMCCMCI